MLIATLVATQAQQIFTLSVMAESNRSIPDKIKSFFHRKKDSIKKTGA
jgi:hypothetical protein